MMGCHLGQGHTRHPHLGACTIAVRGLRASSAMAALGARADKKGIHSASASSPTTPSPLTAQQKKPVHPLPPLVRLRHTLVHSDLQEVLIARRGYGRAGHR